MHEYLNEAFNAGGHLSRELDGYKPRAGQIDYAAAVDNAIRKGRHLMVEGSTGTGKTLAYSVPAIYHASHSQKRVLIVTSNIALQEQLITKDLPLLEDALPWPFSYKTIKGKANYVCLLQVSDHQTDQLKLFPNKDDDEMAQAIITWSTMTPDGDRSALPFEPPNRVWGKFSVSSDDCIGSACPHVMDCFSVKARQELEQAKVVVTNYHMLFSHLKVLEATGRHIILPPFDVLIMDEGHHAADIAREFLGFKITTYAIDHIARAVGGNDQADLMTAADVFFGALNHHYRSGRYKNRLKEKFGKNVWGDLCDKLTHVSETLWIMASAAGDVEKVKLRQSSRRAKEIAQQVQQAMTDRKSRVAYYIEEQRSTLALRSKVVDVGPWIKTNLFDNIPTVIVTSATLATSGQFDYVAGELGADHYDELIVQSPFDWSKQVVTVMPKMPDPRDRGWLDAVADRIIEAIGHAQGRTLALFTSYRSLNHTYERLQAAGLPYRIMKQGEMPRTTLIEEFKDDPASVLLGTESFWGGVDVPGEALSCLVIDKLPFPNPTDPVMDLLQEEDDRCFFNHSVPRAIIKLKQGVGRLIRTVDDHGAVVLLDCRLTTKGYGKQFVRSLPRTVKTRDMSVIRQFLDDVRPRANPEEVIDAVSV